MRVWVSEPRACIFHVNSPGVNVGWPRLSLTLVPCAGLAFWWGYKTNQIFISDTLSFLEFLLDSFL